MSFNRENIAWQSADGTWNRGFYEVWPNHSNDDDEDYDPEWDVDYNYDAFGWVSTGHATKESAFHAWDGANPGGIDVAQYSGEANEHLDDMAALHQERERRHAEEARSAGYNYHNFGARRQNTHRIQRPLHRLAKGYYEGRLKLMNHQVGGYANAMDADAELMGEMLKSRLERGNESEEELRKALDERKAFLKKGKELIAQAEKSNAERIKNSHVYGGYGNGGYAFRQENNHAVGSIARARKIMEDKDEIAQLVSKKLKEEERAREDRKESAPKALRKGDAPSSAAPGDPETVAKKPYHVNPETGRANKCTATKRPCPLGRNEPHYATKDEARASYEKKRQGDTLPKATKKK